MKPQDKIAINNLRLEGKNAREIALLLKISPNTIRSYIRRHPVISGTICCMNCGRPVLQTPHHRTKKFCSNACRMQWWKEHPESLRKKAYYVLTCQHCGKEFQSYGNKERKYCCRDCYIKSVRPLWSGTTDRVPFLTVTKDE